jgi:putative membrane protein
MKQLVKAERFCLIGHIVSMAFGLAGLLLVVPHAEVILNLGETGQTVMQWSMAGGGVVYMILGTAAVAIYGYRQLGLNAMLSFMLPAVFLSLGSELLGTSTGFPFGHYSYLSGLGYKIAGLVPFTIPLSWFYVGLVSYLIARAGLEVEKKTSLVRHMGAIALGALALTSWDFVLDPAMSQTALPFWYWQQPGAFFGMPYQNFVGWFGTGALFMTVAAVLWKNMSLNLDRSRLSVPLVVYLSNFAFAAVMSCAAGFWIPVLLGLVVGVAPVVTLWWMAQPSTANTTFAEAATEMPAAPIEVAYK